MRETLRFDVTKRHPAAVWLGLVLFALGCFSAAAASFTASLDRDSVVIGESATLTLKFDGGTPKAIPVPPNVPNLQFTDRGTSQSFSLVNGQMSGSISETFEVVPSKPGDYLIPGLQAEVNGQILTSQPLKLTVVKAGAQSGENANQQLAFMKVFVPRPELYLGEVVAVQLQVFIRDGVANEEGILQAIENYNGSALKAEGFSVLKAAGAQRRRVQIGNAVFNVGTLVLAVTPVKTGTQTIDAFTPTVSLQLPVANQRRDAFDPFGMLQQYQERRVTLMAEAQSVNVLPLPVENRPASFNGAVGTFSLAESAGPTNVATGDPITVRVQISGHGVLDSLALPEQKAWENFKVYPPTAKIDSNDPLGIDGTKTFEQVVVPQNSDIRALPPISFSFFNPDKKTYETLTRPAIALVVRPGGQTTMPNIEATRNPQDNTPKQDIVPIKQRLGTVAAVGTPLIQQPWFVGLQAVPVLAFFSALVWRKRSDALANNPRLQRQRKVEQIVREGLIDLRKLAAENKSDEFFATLFRLLQEQLGERLDLPASSITEAVIDERLRPAGASDNTLSALHELFQACNMARYAPIKSSHELAAFVPKLETVLTSVKTELAGHKSSTKSSRVAVIAFVLLLAGFAHRSFAAEVPSDFDAANKLYEQGKFAEAAAGYEKLLQSGVAAPALYFNVGNAYFKSGQIGRALAEYRTAEKLAPRDPDVRANLQFVRTQVSNPTLAPTRWQHAFGTLTVNEWATLAAVAFWLTLVLLTAAQLRPALKRPLRSLMMLGMAATVVLGGCLAMAWPNASMKTAIIVSHDAIIRNGPLDESPSAFTAHDGAELRILDSKDNWLQVAAAENRIGWVKRDQVVEE